MRPPHLPPTGARATRRSNCGEGQATDTRRGSTPTPKGIAQSKKVDLIVVGSHGRHGLGLLLGATANGVLHGANCDVLTVRVDPTEGG